MGAAALVGIAALRALRPLVSADDDRTAMVGQRTRVALEREKILTLRSIKELEFDRAMGKLSESDWQEMSARLRVRAAGLMRQLDAGVGISGADRARSRKAAGQCAPASSTDVRHPRKLLHRMRDGERRRREVLQELRAQAVILKDAHHRGHGGHEGLLGSGPSVSFVSSVVEILPSRASSRCPIPSRCRASRGRSAISPTAACRSA